MKSIRFFCVLLLCSVIWSCADNDDDKKAYLEFDRMVNVYFRFVDKDGNDLIDPASPKCIINTDYIKFWSYYEQKEIEDKWYDTEVDYFNGKEHRRIPYSVRILKDDNGYYLEWAYYYYRREDSWEFTLKWIDGVEATAISIHKEDWTRKKPVLYVNDQILKCEKQTKSYYFSCTIELPL